MHSPCATQVSHLMSSSAHVPSPALAASAASHQPHARRHVAALPAEPHAASAQGASPRSKWRGAHEAAVAHTMLLLGPSRASRRGVRARWLRVLALGNRGPPRARRGRRGHARSAAPTALCAEEGTRGAQRCSRRSVSERRLRAAGGRVPVCHGGSPPSLMKAGFFVHSPCATQVSHLMSSSAHVPSPALAASAASHQPHARRHVAALPAEPHAASAQGASPRSKWRGAHEAAVAHTMLLLGPSHAFLVVHAWCGSPIAAKITRKRALLTHESVVELALPAPHPIFTVRGGVGAPARDDHLFAGTDRVEDEQARVLADVLACRQRPRRSVHTPLLP